VFLRVPILNLYVGTVKSEKVNVDVRRISRHKQDKGGSDLCTSLWLVHRVQGGGDSQTSRKSVHEYSKVVSAYAPAAFTPPKKYS